MTRGISRSGSSLPMRTALNGIRAEQQASGFAMLAALETAVASRGANLRYGANLEGST